MRPLIIVLPALLALAGPAAASGGIWCSVEDAALKLDISSGMTHGGGGGFFNFKAAAAVKLAGTPPDFQELLLNDGLMHDWIDAREIKLLLYTERNAGLFGAVRIVIETRKVDKGDYRGTYTLTVESAGNEPDDFKTLEATGPVECMAE